MKKKDHFLYIYKIKKIKKGPHRMLLLQKKLFYLKKKKKKERKI